MQCIKYPVQEVDIKTIPKNKMLSLSITQTQKALCERSIRQYGLLTPIVLMENPSGELMTLTGENELEVLKEMNVLRAEVFVTRLKDRADSCKVILLLSSLQKGLNALSEGLILREIMQTGGYTQKELAENLMKSKSWVSKRLALSAQLNEKVAEMLLAKQLCPASAQDIARLPRDVQHGFALQIYTGNIPRSKVERLVTAYNSAKTPEAVKAEIIKNPAGALNVVDPVQFQKCADKDDKKDLMAKFDGSIRLVLKLIAEVEIYLTSMADEDIKKYSRLLPLVCSSMGRFIKLVEHLVSSGKLFIGGAHDA